MRSCATPLSVNPRSTLLLPTALLTLMLLLCSGVAGAVPGVWISDGNNGSNVYRYDLNANLLGSFGGTPGGTSAVAMALVPEPNTALLLGIGLSALAVRRENR